MKAKVIQDFRDKHSGKLHKAGEILDITEERYAEILETAPLVKKAREPKKSKKCRYKRSIF